jgi:hypothetical protein
MLGVARAPGLLLVACHSTVTAPHWQFGISSRCKPDAEPEPEPASGLVSGRPEQPSWTRCFNQESNPRTLASRPRPTVASALAATTNTRAHRAFASPPSRSEQSRRRHSTAELRHQRHVRFPHHSRDGGLKSIMMRLLLVVVLALASAYGRTASSEVASAAPIPLCAPVSAHSRPPPIAHALHARARTPSSARGVP